jgi:hypothetical protein
MPDTVVLVFPFTPVTRYEKQGARTHRMPVSTTRYQPPETGAVWLGAYVAQTRSRSSVRLPKTGPRSSAALESAPSGIAETLRPFRSTALAT